MVHLIKKYHPIVYSNSDKNNKLLTWGSWYSTFSEFTLFFQKAAIKVKSYKMMITNNDIYPTKWCVAVSNNNQTWENISCIDEHFCLKENQEILYSGGSLKCKVTETRSFAANKHEGYYQFVKFHLSENSYYDSEVKWKQYITIYGFELIGNIFNMPTNICKSYFKPAISLCIAVMTYSV